ncbi:hypothetical protein [Streptomyces sp. NPDC001635]
MSPNAVQLQSLVIRDAEGNPTQVYDHAERAKAERAAAAALVDKAASAYARGGEMIAPDALDIHLAEIADKGSCSLLRDQWADHFPVAAYTELLSTVAALRSVLGFVPSPTAREVNDWAKSVQTASHEAAMGQPADLHEVRIVEGPHRGVVLALWGMKAPQSPDTMVGPPLALELSIVRGDSEDLEHGIAYYRRLKRPNPDTNQWEYWLDRGRPFPAEGMRPQMLPVPERTDGAA